MRKLSILSAAAGLIIVAGAMVAQGQLKAARHLLQTGIARSPDSASVFPLQQKMLQSLGPEAEAASVRRELRKLRRRLRS